MTVSLPLAHAADWIGAVVIAVPVLLLVLFYFLLARVTRDRAATVVGEEIDDTART